MIKISAMKIDAVKNKILNLVIIIFAFVVASNIYKAQTKNIASVKQNQETETKRNEVLREIMRSEKVISSYKLFLNRKDISSVLNTLSNIAREVGVNIISLRPIGERVYLSYVKYPFSLSINAESYQEIGKFISRLESHPDFYLVENLRIRQIGAQQLEKATKVIADLETSTYLFKD